MDTLLIILFIIFLLVGGYGSIVDSSKRDFHFGTFWRFRNDHYRDYFNNQSFNKIDF